MEYLEKNRKGSFNLEITTSALCDMGCTYCFEGEKVDKNKLDADLPLIFKRINSILNDETWFKRKYESLSISFWGGEPTLNPQLIIEVMKNYQDNPVIDFHLYTNGFNSKNLDTILANVKSEKLNIQVSYDGRLINDKYRLTKNNKSTSNQVLNTIYELAQKGANLSLKSTLPIENMEVLSDTWDDFLYIQNMLWKIDPNLHISYSPTIDYITKVADEEKAEALKVFRNEFLKIAKKEIAFYEKHNRYLCSWFGGDDSRIHCAAGLNMTAIDQRGNMYACHGAIYSSKKEELINTTIYEDDFLEKVIANSVKFEEPLKKIAPTCRDCVATTCMICPVASHERSQKEDFFEAWTDNWVNNLCGFFKAFGEIDRAVQRHQILKRNDNHRKEA